LRHFLLPFFFATLLFLIQPLLIMRFLRASNSILRVVLIVSVAFGVQRAFAQGEREDDMRERARFFFDRLTSGQIKDPATIRRIGLESFQAMDNRAAMKAEQTTTWQSVGTGTNGATSGRLRAVAFDTIDGKTAYLAAAVGGVWRTNDLTAAKVQWTSIGDNLPTLVCSAVAIAPNDHNTVYIGTGENYAGDVAPDGQGVFKSVDGGLNWTNVLTASIVGTAINEIAIDPRNPKSVWVAAPGSYYPLTAQSDTTTAQGLFHTTNGGTTWQRIDLGPSFFAVAVRIDPKESKRIYACGFHGELYRSADGGNTWDPASINITTTPVNPQIAIAPSSPNVIYYAAASQPRFWGSAGIYRSADYGVTWVLVNPASNTSNPASPTYNYLKYQGYYGNSIAVSPISPDAIVVGGVDLFVSVDGGVTLEKWTDWSAAVTSINYSHADVHQIIATKTAILSCNDGGLTIADLSFQNLQTTRSANLPTLEFVGIDADQMLTKFIGGTQDNGTVVSNRINPSWTNTRGGDGGNTWMSQSGDTAFATYTRTSIYRTNSGGLTWSDSANLYVSLATNSSLVSESAPFYAAYDVAPDANIIAFGGNSHVFVSRNGGKDGFLRTGSPSIGKITCVRVSKYSAQNMWAGTTGFIARSTNTGVSWTLVATPAIGDVTGIVQGADDRTLYATVGGLSDDPSVRFLVSNDGGVTWSHPAYNFPRAQAHTIARTKKGQLFVGTEYGVITSNDNGVHWSQFGLGLPIVQVLSLKVKGQNDEFLLAGTMGRGAYWIDIPTAGVAKNIPISFSVGECFPNPVAGHANSESELRFTLTHDQLTTARLFDALGHEVLTLAKTHFTSGDHTLHIPTTNLTTGEYFITLESEGSALVRKLTVVK
jgi:photosystem II stability/assembly factor-like uncharacterized protein